MTEPFYLDPQGLSNVTARMGQLGGNLGTAYDTLSGVLDEHDGCWGTDSTGKAFANNYVSSEQQMRDGAQQAASGVGGVTDTVNQAAAKLESVDYDSAAELDASYDPGD